ncbi:MAG TPA: HlyD family type I secretion periplasmic adaptor subunit [Aurantimonas coralicida]|uniref:Membrane fusion protein (MFP) family protein n=2 Tax=root TaxID=1 RepID=A0A9C9NE27_9HYPH|nr:HlyD family type I secretion periplasmic adaptor subunit [Aurantimonas coralicida]HEU00147.1 HlyD family type I secretion periplasmic adaptor subunit [Aurantimonas coralicida]
MSRRGKEAIEEWYLDVPRSIRRPLLAGALIITAIFGGFGAWAATAPLAAAVVTPGSFVATGRNKQVQHLEGGIIRKILVNEGEHVDKGQIIIILDKTAARTNVRRLTLRLALFEARSLRLQAMMTGSDSPDFSRIHVEDEDIAERERIIGSQRSLFIAETKGLEGNISIAEKNRDSLRSRIQGATAQKQAIETQQSLIAEEMAAKRSLFKQGLYRRSDLFAIERAAAEAAGMLGKLESDIGDFESQVTRLNGQIEQIRQEFRQKATDEVQGVLAEIDDMREQMMSARAVLDRSEIRAPASGILIRLNYHTAGGVIESGKEIAEILPDGDRLVIETVVNPRDIDDVHVGQAAGVRLMSFSQRTTPQLTGEVVYVSADTVSDPRAGKSGDVYIARIALAKDQIDRVSQLTITPGMPADVFIQTATRTFFDYVTKPVRDSMERAFLEK